MNQMKRILALALALALGASLMTGCSGGDGSGSAGSSSASSSASSSGDASTEHNAVQPMDLTGVTDPYLATAGIARDAVVARVGEYDITAAELLYWLNTQVENYITQMQYMGMAMTEMPWDTDMGGMTLEQAILDGSLETAAFYRLLPELAEAAGLELSEVDKEFPQADIDMCIQELGSEELMSHWMWFRMMDADLYTQLYYGGCYFGLIQEHYFGEGAEGYPTDAEAKAYAEDVLGYYRVKHILIGTTQTVTNEDGTTSSVALDEAGKAEKLAQAEDLLNQINAAGDPIAKFDELMNQYSEDPGLAAYPDGYDAVVGQMVPEFEAASLALEDGEISGIVESPHGYHIILRLPIDLELVRPELVAERFDAKIVQWIEEHGVETTEAFDQIDPSAIRDQVVALQTTVQAELQAVFAEKEAAAGSADGSASGSQG